VGTNHISGTAEARVIKFCIHVGHIKSHHMEDKSPLKEANHCNQVHVTHSNFAAPMILLYWLEARVVNTLVDYIISQSKDDKAPPKGAWSVARDQFFNFDTRNHISGTAEATVAKFCMPVEYIKCLAFDDRLSLIGVVRVTRPVCFLNFAPIISLELVKLGTSNFVS